jgi:hypothetical protein
VSRSTWLYVALSVVLLASGIAIVLASKQVTTDAQHHLKTSYEQVWFAVGTSIFAGGIASIAFTGIRELDQRDADGAHQRLEELSLKSKDLNEGLTELRRVMLLTNDPDSRRIFKPHPVQEVQDELDAADDDVCVQVMGLALRSFYEDQVGPVLKGRPQATIYLLTQNPLAPTFAQLCYQEGRDRAVMTADVIWVSERVKAWNQSRQAGPRPTMEVRWLSDFPSITMTMVDGWMAVRPRFVNEGSGGHYGFFEQYTADDKEAFAALSRLFGVLWKRSDAPTDKMLADAKTLHEKVTTQKDQDQASAAVTLLPPAHPAPTAQP